MFDVLIIGEIDSAEFGAGGARSSIRYAVMYFRFETESALKILLAGNSIRAIPSSQILEKGTLVPPDGPVPKTGNEITSLETRDEAMLLVRRARANPSGLLALKGFAPTTPVHSMTLDLVCTAVDVDE